MEEERKDEAGQVSMDWICDSHTRTYQNDHFINSIIRSRPLACILLNQDACREVEISFYRWWWTIEDLREGPDLSHLGSSWYCSRRREGGLEAKKQILRLLQQCREMIIRTSARAGNVGLQGRGEQWESRMVLMEKGVMDLWCLVLEYNWAERSRRGSYVGKVTEKNECSLGHLGLLSLFSPFHLMALSGALTSVSLDLFLGLLFHTPHPIC